MIEILVLLLMVPGSLALGFLLSKLTDWIDPTILDVGIWANGRHPDPKPRAEIRLEGLTLPPVTEQKEAQLPIFSEQFMNEFGTWLEKAAADEPTPVPRFTVTPKSGER